MTDPSNKVSNWLQFAVLLVTIIVLAMHGEGRLARVEQQLTDAEKARVELISHIDRLEERLDKLSE